MDGSQYSSTANIPAQVTNTEGGTNTERLISCTPDLAAQEVNNLTKFNFPKDSVFSPPRVIKLNPQRELIKMHSPFLNEALLLVADPDSRKKRITLEIPTKHRLATMGLNNHMSSNRVSSRSNGDHVAKNVVLTSTDTETNPNMKEKIKPNTFERIEVMVKRLCPKDEADMSSDSNDEEI